MNIFVTIWQGMAAPVITPVVSNDTQKNYLMEPALIEDPPDVFYIIMDEMASFEAMEKMYNDDNSEFISFLQNNHFYTSSSSKNSSHQTGKITANLLNLDYVVPLEENQDNAAKRRHYAKLFDYFRSRGYQTYAIENGISPEWYIQNADVSIVDNSDVLLNFKKVVLSHSILKYTITNMTKYTTLIDTFQKIKDLAPKEKQPKFLFAHILCPHYPFALTNTQGGIGEDQQSIQGYISEYHAAEQQLEMVISIILAQNPDSVIIIQSDHGYRAFPVHEYAHSIMNTVYYRGDIRSDIEGLSGVNTLRLLVGDILELQLDPVEDLDYRQIEDQQIIAERNIEY